MKSDTHSWFDLSALNCRLTLSSGHGALVSLTVARSIEHRFPYLYPLNHLQDELMRRYRSRKEGDPANKGLQRGIHLSINGVAAGLRNTG